MITKKFEIGTKTRRKGSRSLYLMLLGVLLLIIVAACTAMSTVFGFGAAMLPESTIFARSPADTPVITSGEAKRPIFIADPGVYADGEGLHLFFTTPFQFKNGRWFYAMNPGDPDTFVIESPTIGTIGYAFSADEGVTWSFRETPIVMPDKDGWQTDIETAFPFRLGNRFYLLYSAHGDIDGTVLSNRFQIGAAELNIYEAESLRDLFLDPDTLFTKRDSPLIAGERDRIGPTNNTQEPSAVIHDGCVTIFFTGIGLAKPEASITAQGQRLLSIDFMSAEFDSQLQRIDGGTSRRLRIKQPINIQEVRYHDGTYHVFFTTLTGTGEFHRGEEIGYATSKDGITWSDQVVILKPSSEHNFDDWGLMAPTVALLEDKTVLFYSAFEGLERPPYPVPPNGRIGIGLEEDPGVTVLANIGRAVAERL